MKKLEIVIQSYNRGILSRETRETFSFPAETLRREELVNVHGVLRRVLGVGEMWLRGLRAAHYCALKDGRVDSVSVHRTLSNASLHVTVNRDSDISPVLHAILRDLRMLHFPV